MEINQTKKDKECVAEIKLLLQSKTSTFIEEFQKQSKPLSPQDEQTLKEIILLKSKPGVPRF